MRGPYLFQYLPSSVSVTVNTDSGHGYNAGRLLQTFNVIFDVIIFDLSNIITSPGTRGFLAVKFSSMPITTLLKGGCRRKYFSLVSAVQEV